MTPQVTAYEDIGPGIGWSVDPREIIRSLPSHVQQRLRSRKPNYARNEDFNRVRESSPSPFVARGRGRPKRTTSGLMKIRRYSYSMPHLT